MTILQATLSNILQFLFNRVPGALIIVVLGGLATAGLASALEATLRRARVEPTITSLAKSVVTAAGWIIVLAATLQALGLDQIALTVGGGLAFVALGIANALSGTIGDVNAGIFLAGDPDFKIGFTVQSGELTGVIESVDLRKVRLRGADGKLYVVPNRTVESQAWVVLARGEAAEGKKVKAEGRGQGAREAGSKPGAREAGRRRGAESRKARE